MYYMFRHHNMLPSVFYQLPAGERIVLRAFAMQEIEDFANRE
ncbi:MAG: hypothetical protein ACLUDG_05470 [Butyricicoccus sp.]